MAAARNRLDKVLGWIARISIAATLIVFAPAILLLFFLSVVTPVALFFEQDYRPWNGSMSDLAMTWHEVRANTDSYRIEALENRSGQLRSEDCSAFTREVQKADSFLLAASAYCKIRVRTPCACDGGDNWIKIEVTHGRYAGRKGWVCRSAVGLTVAMP